MSVTYNPSQFTKGARATFLAGAEASTPMLLDYCATYVESDSYSEDYAWIGEAPSFEEFRDEVRFKSMSDGTYQLANIKYTTGLQVKSDDIKDEKVGGLGLRIMEMGQKSSAYTDYLLSQALINGTSATLGANVAAGAFFRNDHPARGDEGGTQSNLFSQAGTSVSNVQEDVGEVLSAMMELKGEDGHPCNLGFKQVAVIVPAPLYFTALEALTAPILSQTSNVRFKDFRIEVVCNPYLLDDADFYVSIVDTPIRGLVMQDREPASFHAQDTEEHDAAFLREVYRYKAKMRRVAGYGRWQKLAKVA